MSLYVFDTDVLSLLRKERLPAGADRRIANVPGDRAATTAITVGELHYGALRSATPSRWMKAIEAVTATLECLPFDATAAERYGEIRAYLESRGERLADADLRIASICLATDRTLVSGNDRHFRRVPDLRYENWLVGPPG